jgi:hypothetical protein
MGLFPIETPQITNQRAATFQRRRRGIVVEPQTKIKSLEGSTLA